MKNVDVDERVSPLVSPLRVCVIVTLPLIESNSNGSVCEDGKLG